MAQQNTGIGPIRTTIHTTDDDSGNPITIQTHIVAFSWHDSDPSFATGYWYFGGDSPFDGKLVHIPIEAISDWSPSR